MKKFTLALLVSLLGLYAYSQPPATGKKQLDALRVATPITIDGILNEPAWTEAANADQFVQFEPNPGVPPTSDTEVKVIYDNSGIYIGARMFDSRPDSIQQELSQRDRLGNTDWFGVFIDAYKDGINGLMFLVTPAGVQFDAKISALQSNNGWQVIRGDDVNWDAVWESHAQITPEGWVAEIKIPYSAIRFPKAEKQNWNINFGRVIRRYQQRSYWNSVDPQQTGFFNQAGQIGNIEDIKAPLRLQAFPFVAVYGEKYHDKDASPSTSYGHSFNGGLDIKYGINDAFTLDMTLIPDFGQAQSDNQILNLSPFEVRFDENRAFFTEGTELFNKGGLFYSRRVGGRPLHYYDVEDQLQEGEEIIENPQQSQLYNATKISGRTNKGLGIGFFNATSGNTTARIRNSEGQVREMQTNPLTNFNVLVLDQNLPHNSYVTLINTTVLRKGPDYDANVTGAVFDLRNKANAYSISGQGVLTQQYYTDRTDLGHSYNLSLSKISGNLFWGLHYNEYSNTYNPNDLGFLFNNNYRDVNGFVEYDRFKPFWKIFNSGGIGFWNGYTRQYVPDAYANYGVNFWAFVQTTGFWNFNVFTYHEPFVTYDYYEPRVAGRKYLYPTNNNYGFNINSDSRKRFQVGVYTNFRNWSENGRYRWNWTVAPGFRVNNKLNFRLEMSTYNFINDVGFADTQTKDVIDPVSGETTQVEEIIFGRRDNITVENVLNTGYTFNKNMSLTFRLRHYWSKVAYSQYNLLLEDGGLGPTDYAGNRDGNYNAFNIDMVYRWRFAPGSDLFLIWKNAVYGYEDVASPNYYRNLDRVFDAPQSNSLSLKVVYYLDYATLMKK